MINKQAARDKQLLAWDRERQILEKRLHNPPVHILAKPIQQGWKRQFVLTHEARLRPDATILEDILEDINTVVYHWRPDFQPSRRQLRLSRRTLSSEQFLRAIGIQAWERGEYPDTWQTYFRRELVPYSLVNESRLKVIRCRWVRRGLWERRKGHVLAFAFRFPRLFALKTERHWLTHVKELEPEVVRRREELVAYISQQNGFHRLDRLFGRSHRAWNDPNWREKISRQLAVQEIRAHLGASNRIESPGAADAMPPPYPRRWRHAVGGVRVAAIFVGHISNLAARRAAIKTNHFRKETPHATIRCSLARPRRARPGGGRPRRARPLRLRKRQPCLGLRLARQRL